MESGIHGRPCISSCLYPVLIGFVYSSLCRCLFSLELVRCHRNTMFVCSVCEVFLVGQFWWDDNIE